MSSRALSDAPILDRKAVELALKWHGIDVDAFLRTWRIRSRDRWPDHALVRDSFVFTAVHVHQERALARGLSRTAALRAACEELGVSYSATRSRLRRHRSAYMEASTDSGTSGANCTRIAKKAG